MVNLGLPKKQNITTGAHIFHPRRRRGIYLGFARLCRTTDITSYAIAIGFAYTFLATKRIVVVLIHRGCYEPPWAINIISFNDLWLLQQVVCFIVHLVYLL